MRKRSLFVCGVTHALAPGGHQGTTGVQRASFFVSPHAHQAIPCRQRATNTRVAGGNQHAEDSSHEEEEDTIRVKIWRALASGEEMRLSELGNTVGERRMGELRSHLVHVERQAKTLRNKPDEWRIRRGIVRPVDIKSGDEVNEHLSPFAFKKKIRLKMRKGKGNDVFIRFV